ncbi:MAG: hypothetical protein ABSG53_05695 [Thermoguttaceae bacterium]|jgi:predicted Zn-dependent peptidase
MRQRRYNLGLGESLCVSHPKGKPVIVSPGYRATIKRKDAADLLRYLRKHGAPSIYKEEALTSA